MRQILKQVHSTQVPRPADDDSVPPADPDPNG